MPKPSEEYPLTDKPEEMREVFPAWSADDMRMRVTKQGQFIIYCCLMKLICALCFPVTVLAGEALPGRAVQGVLDLSRWIFEEGDIAILDGEWEFYQNQLLTPDELTRLDGSVKPSYLSPLALWKEKAEVASKSRHGYATYRLRVKLSPKKMSYILRSGKIRTASKLWIDGQLAAERGVVGRDKEHTVPYEKPIFHPFDAKSAEIELVFWQSDFYTFAGNGGTQFYLGEASVMRAELRRDILWDCFFIGCLAILALYHIGLWALRRDRYDPLIFSVYCFVMAMRPLMTGDSFPIYYLSGSLPWVMILKLEFIGVSLLVPLMCHFFYLLFPQDLSVRLVRSAWVVGVFFLLDFVLLPTATMGLHLRILQVLLIILAIAIFAGVLLAAVRHRIGAGFMVCGAAVLFAGLLNDILLSNRWIDSVFVIPVATLFFAFTQAMVMSIQFSQTFAGLLKTKRDLNSLNEKLESEVAERTQTISTIVNNVRTGFFTIDRNLCIGAGFTQSCNTVLNLNLQQGLSILSVFSMSERERDRFESCIEQVFDDLLPSEVSLANLTSRYRLNDRLYSLEGAVVRAADGSIGKILFTACDITRLSKIELESHHNRMLLTILNYKDAFRSFVADSFERMARIKKGFKEDDQSQIRSDLHTIKGNAASFDLGEISWHIHQMEEQEQITSWDIEMLSEKLRAFLRENGAILSIDHLSSDGETYTIAVRRLFELYQKLQSSKDLHESRLLLQEWIETAGQVPIAGILGPIERTVKNVAERLGKQVNFTVDGGEIAISPERYSELLHSLVHLVRNAIDHGIEPPFERGNKPSAGRITLAFDKDASGYRITVRDDGRGIDRSALIQKAVRSGLITVSAAALLTDREILDLAFLDSISTSDDVTDISGRGVGLAAVRAAALKCGGSIAVESTPGQGTLFLINLPDQPKTSVKAA
jgi:signal transduction histidine kinase